MQPPMDSLANPAGRMSLYNKIVNAQLSQTLPTHRPLRRERSNATMTGSGTLPPQQNRPGKDVTQPTQEPYLRTVPPTPAGTGPPSPVLTRKVGQTPQRPDSVAAGPGQSARPPSFAPYFDTYPGPGAGRDMNIPNMQLPGNLTADDFTRAVAVATVSALRHQQEQPQRQLQRVVEEEAHAGHDAPSWSRTMSASVLLGCTLLYAIIAGMSCQLASIYPC